MTDEHKKYMSGGEMIMMIGHTQYVISINFREAGSSLEDKTLRAVRSDCEKRIA